NHRIASEREGLSGSPACQSPKAARVPSGSQNLPLFARSLLALVIRGGQPHPDQTPDGVGTGWMVGLRVAPFINVLLPRQIKPKTHDRSLPNARTTAFF